MSKISRWEDVINYLKHKEEGYAYSDSYQQKMDNLLVSYESEPKLKELFLTAVTECEEHNLTFSLPEILPGLYLFIGDGPPNKTENEVFDIFITFAPFKNKNNIGTNFRNCITKALPKQQVSFVNAYSCYKDEAKSSHFLKSLLPFGKWKLIAVGEKAFDLCNSWGIPIDAKITHPSYSLGHKKNIIGEEKYIVEIIKQVDFLV